MSKIIIYDNDANKKILEGVSKLEKAVTSTLGPAGKNVIIDEGGQIHSTKDGVTVARSIVLKDPFENLGANAIKEVAQKSNDRVGDGTTTSTLLAVSIYRNGLKYVSLGSNATQIKNGISKAAKRAVEIVKSMATPISTKDDIKRVCTVSANGDEEIGEIISSVMDKIGKDGVIKVEDGQTAEVTSKIVEGMVLDNGYISPWMTTNQETNDADMDNPFIVIVNKKISNIQEFIPCLQSVSETGKPLVIIADDYAEDITSTLVMNKLRGFNCVAVKSPSYGDNRKSILQDIAIMVGGQVVSDENGVKLEQATVGSGIIGMAKRVLVTKNSTVIFDGFGDKEQVNARIEMLRSQVEKSTDDYDADKLKDRLGKLANGIGIISVGADTEAERKEKRDRVDDAFSAAKAAIKGGIVAGGGSALLHVKKQFDKNENIMTELNLIGDENIGVEIFCQSLEAPIRKILDNAGIDSSLIVSKLLDMNETCSLGYNVLSRNIVDMINDGIIDAAEVVINEIKNASSIASLLLTTDVLIVEEPAEKQATPQLPPMM